MITDWVKYDPDTGNIIWIQKPKSRYDIKVGDIAGRNHNQGYLQTKIEGKVYLNHRLGWFLYFDYWPKELDHKNGNRKDNKLKNLREVTRSQNQQNKQSQKNKTSKYKGVSWCKSRQKWCAYIKIKNKTKNLGRFENEKIAATKYNEAAVKAFGNFAYLNEVTL